MASYNLPDNPKLALKVIDADRERINRQLTIGWMGHVFGAGSEKPGNIAGLAFIFAAFIMIGVFMFGPAGADKTALMGVVGSVFTGSLGYIFGKGEGKS